MLFGRTAVELTEKGGREEGMTPAKGCRSESNVNLFLNFRVY